MPRAQRRRAHSSVEENNPLWDARRSLELIPLRGARQRHEGALEQSWTEPSRTAIGRAVEKRSASGNARQHVSVRRSSILRFGCSPTAGINNPTSPLLCSLSKLASPLSFAI